MLKRLMTSWHLNIWKVVKLDYLKNEKKFLSETKYIFLVSQGALLDIQNKLVKM